MLSWASNPNLCAQDPVVQWDNTIGGTGTDNLITASQTSDGGYILGGTSTTGINGDKTELCKGGYDFWIIKLDALGNITWQNTIGTTAYDYLVDVVEATDGGYLVTGYTTAGVSVDKTTASYGGYDYWILKLTPTGEVVWQKEIGGSGNDYLTHAYSISGGGFILGGYSNSGISGNKTEASIGGYDYWIVKINSVGNIIWQHTLGGISDDYLMNSKKISTGNYVLAGYSTSGIGGQKNEACIGGTDYWVILMDPSGSVLWQNTIGGSGYDKLMDFVELDSKNIILTGHSKSNISGDKSELSHNTLYETEWYDEAELENTDDLWIVKINPLGEIIWEKTYGYDYSEENVVNSFIENENRIMITGRLMSDYTYISKYYTVAIDTNGYIVWEDALYGQYEEDNWEDGVYNFEDNDLHCAFNIPGNGYLLAGSSSGNAGFDKTEDAWATGYGVGYNTDYWILKMGPDTCSTSPLYADYDGDDKGGSYVANACELSNSPFVFDNGDCNDNNSAIYTDAVEICDGIDNNCNGVIDEGLLDCYPGPATIWDITLGGTDTDKLNTTAIAVDGSYFLGGTTGSTSDDIVINNGGLDLTVFKLDASGNVIWNVVYGGSLDDELKSIAPTSDNGVVLGAYSLSGISGDKTESNYGNYDYWIIKLDANGNIMWQNSIGGSSLDELCIIRQCADGGYLLGGKSFSGISGEKTESNFGSDDYWVIKLNALGNIVWQNSIGGSGSENLRSLIEMPDGSIILGGSSSSGISGDKTLASFGSNDYWVVKLSAVGNILWQKVFGGVGHDELTCMEKSFDNNILIGGYSTSGVSGNKTEASISYDYWILKLNTAGDILWQNTVKGEDFDYCTAISETNEHNIVVAGYSKSIDSEDKIEKFVLESPEASYYSNFEYNEYDYWLVTLNAAGTLIWQNTIGGNMNDYATALSVDPSGKILLSGYSASYISSDKTQNPKGKPEEIELLEDYSSEGIFGDYDFWSILLESDECVPSIEMCNFFDDNCNGLIDDGVIETINITAEGPTNFCQGGSVILHAEFSGTSVQWKKNGVNIPGAILPEYNANKTGTYSAITTSVCGSAISADIFITVNSNPTASISAGGPTTFCAGGSVVLTEVAVTGCTYQWYKGANPIAGATALTYTATTAGNYKCRVTKTASGCYKNSNTIAVSVPCKEGEEVTVENELIIYPNPNNGTFNVTCTTKQNNSNILVIYNALGQQIYAQQIFTESGRINENIVLNNLAVGVYFIHLNGKVQKLIIE